METYLIDFKQISEMVLLYVETTPLSLLFLQGLILFILYHVFRISFILMWIFFQKLHRESIAEEKMIFSQAGPYGKSVLIAGDSTAVGTGASSSAGTFMNMFARDFPKADVTNVAVNGAVTRDILKQFEKYSYLRYDVIIISTGGNDIWSLLTMRTLRQDLIDVLIFSKAMSRGHVILLFFGNAGSAPLFPYFVRKLLLSREKKTLKVFLDVCKQRDVQLIELFTEKNKNPFVEDPKRYFSADGLHPSGAGYALWYEHILKFIQENKYL